MCFFNDTATTEIYTLSLHDALPISDVIFFSTVPSAVPPWLFQVTLSPFFSSSAIVAPRSVRRPQAPRCRTPTWSSLVRSEEHTSELQSRQYLVCRLLLENKKEQRTS